MIDLKPPILGEISQSPKYKYCIIQLLRGSWRTLVVLQGLWGRRSKELLNGYRVPVLQNGKSSGDRLQNSVSEFNTIKLHT